MKHYAMDLLFFGLLVMFTLIFVDSFSKIKTLDTKALTRTIQSSRSK